MYMCIYIYIYIYNYIYIHIRLFFGNNPKRVSFKLIDQQKEGPTSCGSIGIQFWT